MKAIEFYGRTIKVNDISSCENRKTSFFSFFSAIGAIIGWLGLIIFGFFLYMSNMDSKEIIGTIFVFSLIALTIEYVAKLLFAGNSIVVITLHSGDKIKSPAIPNEEAWSLYEYISKILKDKKYE